MHGLVRRADSGTPEVIRTKSTPDRTQPPPLDDCKQRTKNIY